MIKTDVLIVGGGPAGSSCARRLGQNHVASIVLDRADFPRFKPCAGWLTPQVLHSVGPEVQSYPHGLTEFRSFDVSISGIRFKLPTHQYSIRRFEFDHWLLQLASTEFHRHDVRSIRFEKGQYIVDEEYSAPYLVGAGGTHCPVFRTFFSQVSPHKPGSLIVAQEEEFQYDMQDTRCKLWFFEGKLPGYSWVVPKKNGYVNVGIGGFTETLKQRGETLKNHWNGLVNSLEKTGLIRQHVYKQVGHSYYLRQNLAEIRIGNAFIAGDSLGLATLDMGEGIGPAILSGQLVAESILNKVPYSIASIPRYSFPSLFGLRKEN
jgi:menaquinone-9 beta-reductase